MNWQSFAVLIFSFWVVTYSQEKPWERLGLSETEWKQIQEYQIPMSKVEKLLRSGIGICEYVEKPWEDLELSESQWIGKRRSGMTEYDIELEAQSKNRERKSDAGKEIRSEFTSFSGSGDAFSSLFVPGYQQLKQKRTIQGILMTSLAGGALLWCSGASIARRRFEVLPVIVILVPDMVWSFVDFKVYRKNQGT